MSFFYAKRDRIKKDRILTIKKTGLYGNTDKELCSDLGAAWEIVGMELAVLYAVQTEGKMLLEHVIRNELQECIRSKIGAEKDRFDGTGEMPTTEKDTLEGQIYAYEIVLELKHGDTYETMLSMLYGY